MTLLARRQVVHVYLAFAFAYFFSALLRSITATLAPTLTAEFGLSAQQLGLLAGGFFLGFATTQLPLGRWLDRHGPRKVILSFMGIAMAGCLAFSFATGFYQLLAARVLCGVGVSACLMAPLTGFRRWFTPAAQLRGNSWMLMTGSLGMVASTLPVEWLMPLFGWRPLFWGLAVAMLFASLAIVAAAPPWVAHDASSTGTPVSYAQVWRHPYFRRMASIGFVNYGGMLAIQTLWAGPWLVRVVGVPQRAAASGLFTINAAMLFTFWSWGLVNPWFARRGLTANRLIARGLPLSFVILAGIIVAGPHAGAAAWAAFCMASTFVSLAQPAVGIAFPSALAGRALSAYNLVIFAGTFVMQWGIGLLVDGLVALGTTEVTAFRAAMAVFLACGIAAYLHFLGAADNSHP